MSVKCWMCDFETSISDNSFGDHICPSCGVTISIYDPNKPDFKIEKKSDSSYDNYMRERQKKEGMVGDLGNWAKENSKFIKIGDGESYEGEYQGYKTGVNMNGDPAIIYILDGKEFKSSSSSLANQMNKVEKGTKVKISRTGEGIQTKWKVDPL